MSKPWQRANRLFYRKRAADQELYVLYMREGVDGEEKVILDPHTMSEDLTKTVGIQDISDDGKILAYSIRNGGVDEETIKIMNVDTEEHFPDELPEENYFGFCFTKDSAGYYYSKSIEEKSRVYYHQMGSDYSEDIMIFGEGYDRDKIVEIKMSENRRWLLIFVHYGSSANNDLYFMDLAGDKKVKPLVTGIQAYFEGQFADNNFIMRTDWNAPNGRIFNIDMTKSSRSNWREIVPEKEYPIEYHSLAGGKLFVNYLVNVSSKIMIYDINGGAEEELSIPSIGSIDYVKGNWGSNDAFYTFASFHYPKTIFRLKVKENSQDIWFKCDVQVDTDKFKAEQIWYDSKDGTKIPMFIVHSKDLELNSNNIVYLYGYGGFRSNSTPYFSTFATILSENNGIFAYPALRGGAEFGEEWHEAAMFEKKQNTFDDFIAAAEWLIDNGYTKPSKIAIAGGSNGGLLVGACMTQRPELFGAVVCTYPLLDMLRYHDLLMGPYWVSEYGSAEDPEQFKYIYAYSPYHNVKKGTNYPATLFITGDADTRVDPMHARKMTALLQAETGWDKPILLMYDTKAGHSGGKTLSQRIEEATDELNFVFHALGVK
jgi:prolyl oligopeptidase